MKIFRTNRTSPNAWLRHLRWSDLPAVVQLATQTTSGVIGITEGVHQSVRKTLGLSPGADAGRTGGLTGQIYKGVRGSTQLIGHGLAGMLAGVIPKSQDTPGHPAPSTPERDIVVSALNGVLGDHLAASGNPLALPMALRYQGKSLPSGDAAALRLALAGATPKLLLLVHGLCMNAAQWTRGGHDHGAFLARELGFTPIYLRYNSGLHTSVNGRELACMLEQLLDAWPVPLADMCVIGHSMGGLVARSAYLYGSQAGHRWVGQLRSLVFLGTPHHGAPLERAGHGVDVLLGRIPYTAPFTKLARVRSAGITDLRHGHVQDADWQGRDHFHSAKDHRVPSPLPPGVACYAVAAALAGQHGMLADRLAGDGLVPLRSGLGEHAETKHQLAFAPENRWIAWRTGHLALLSSPAVAAQLLQWLGPRTPPMAEATGGG